jgi:hypothetical protein
VRAKIGHNQPPGKLIGYARVSTEDQELRMQLDALRKAGCWNVYEEKRSATRGKRPQLEQQVAEELNDNGRLVCMIAAQLISGDRANPTISNPSTMYQSYALQSVFNLAHEIVRQAMQFSELRK